MQRSSNDAITHQRAMQQFARLGYTVIDGSQEEHGACTVTGRTSLDEVVLRPQLHTALRALNPGYEEALISEAIARLLENRSLLSLANANEQVYALLKDGIKIDAHGQLLAESDEHSGQGTPDRRQDTHKTLRIIDWRERKPENNSFVLVSHFWVNGKLGKRCLDLVAFVNGLPLILLEIATSELENTFATIDQDHKETIPALFWYNAFIVVADPFTGKMGSLTTPWRHFSEWKRISDEREIGNSRLETLIEGVCQPERLLDIVENFTLFDRSQGLNKLIARNHQYLGVNNAIASLCALENARRERRRGGLPEPQQRHGKLGVFWHTQGSGKSYSMVFFVRKVQRTIANHYTFVVITDREELDRQIYKNFHDTATIVEDPQEIQAHNAVHLKRLLGEKHLLLFSLIQKFYSEQPGQNYPEVSDNEQIIVMADEAHRTQYDALARNMRFALPRASFIGFTGTPLMDGEEQTRATFGDYVSIYNFSRAISDGITVPLYWENHTPHIELINPNFEEEMGEILDEFELNEPQIQQVNERYARAENFVVQGERLDLIAADIVSHFMNRGFRGKAMVVAINKITAVRLYNRVQHEWQRYQEALEARLTQERDPDLQVELQTQIEEMRRTDMAVVVSAAVGDIKRFADFSAENGEQVEIVSHHQRCKKQNLADDFKKADHPLRIAFVCAMWMTGFDVPCLSTLYLDRLLKGHTLMQTIARVNRVYQDKVNGLIVDYAGALRKLPEALAIYAREDSSGYSAGGPPIGAKSDLVETLRTKLAETLQFCRDQGIAIDTLLAQLATERDRQKREALLLPAINALVAYDELKLNALLLTSEVSRLYKAILPDAAEQEFTSAVYLFGLIKDGIYQTMRATGVREVLGRATTLVRESLETRNAEERISPETGARRGGFDLRDIDLSALRIELRSGHKYIKAEQLRQLLYERIKRMIEINPVRVAYMEKLDRAIDRYNEGSANFASDPALVDPQKKITQFPGLEAVQERAQQAYADDLVELTAEVAHEEERAAQEGVSEEELTIFDQLTLNMELSIEERSQVKDLANTLLAALRPFFNVLDWQKKPLMLGKVRTTIDDELLKLPSTSYGQDEYAEKCEALFHYVQEHYRSTEDISVA